MPGMHDAANVVLVGGGSIVSGKEIMMLALARGLRDAGFRVEFITSVWGGRDEFVSRLKSEGFTFHRVRLGFISTSLSWKPFVWTLNQLRYWPSLVSGYVKAVQGAAPATVVHTNWHHALLLMPFLNPRRDIYWSHEIPPNRWHYRRVFRGIANRVAAIICVSHAVARSLESFGIHPAKLVVVHNGVLLDPVRRTPASHKPVRLGIVGQIGEWKGHDDVVDALALMRAGAATVTLKVFGTGDAGYVGALKARAAASGVADRIEWYGFVTDQRDILEQIDVCLVPSRFDDPFPLAALEAGISGRPVICTSAGGLPEIVNDGTTGIVVERRNPRQLAAAIETFVQRPELIAAMGDAARNHIQEEFGYPRFVEKFGRLVRRIAVPRMSADPGSGGV